MTDLVTGQKPRPTHPGPVRPPKAGHLPPGAPHPDAPPPGTPTKVLIAGVLLFGCSSLYFTVLLVVSAVMGVGDGLCLPWDGVRP